jgi:hypothetical protein
LCAKSELKHLIAVGFLNPDQDTEMWANPHHCWFPFYHHYYLMLFMVEPH